MKNVRKLFATEILFVVFIYFFFSFILFVRIEILNFFFFRRYISALATFFFWSEVSLTSNWFCFIRFFFKFSFIFNFYWLSPLFERTFWRTVFVNCLIYWISFSCQSFNFFHFSILSFRTTFILFYFSGFPKTIVLFYSLNVIVFSSDSFILFFSTFGWILFYFYFRLSVNFICFSFLG